MLKTMKLKIISELLNSQIYQSILPSSAHRIFFFGGSDPLPPSLDIYIYIYIVARCRKLLNLVENDPKYKPIHNCYTKSGNDSVITKLETLTNETKNSGDYLKHSVWTSNTKISNIN